MKHKLLFLSIVAILTVGCSESDQESKSMEKLSEKTTAAVNSVKEAGSAAADAVMDKGQQLSDTVSDKAESAAEEASNFVKKGSSKVMTAVEDAKEGIATTVESVKEKTGDLLSGNSTSDAQTSLKDKVDVITPETSSVNTESQKEKATSTLAESSSVKTITESSAAAMGISAPSASVSEADLAAGKTIYTAKCVACHGSGAAGAPKLDDSSWAARKAQGTDVLVEHAVKGFRGSSGFMPAKGGYAALTDAEVKAAVMYMLSVVK